MKRKVHLKIVSFLFAELLDIGVVVVFDNVRVWRDECSIV